MRVFVASLATETNTFSQLFIDRAAFLEKRYFPPGAHPSEPSLSTGPIVAARRRASAEGFELVEGTCANANPAGLVCRSAYEELRDEILAQLAAARPVDIVLFGLHGAMVADGYDDCEGDLMARARTLVGPSAIIGATLDPHSHLSDQMVQASDVLVAFKENPHTDFMARADDLVGLCLRAARGEIAPRSAVFDCRTMGGYMTSHEPGRSFVDRLVEMEGKDGILSISIIHGFSAGDVYDMGTKVLVIGDGDAERASALAEKLGLEMLAWGPAGGEPDHYQPEEAIAVAVALGARPVVMADRWDNPGGGVAGDSSTMIEALLRHPEIPSAIGASWDPVAVSICRAAGPGAELGLRFAGKATPTSGRPIDARVRVRAVSDNLLIPFAESTVSLGAAAAITIGNVDVVLCSSRTQTFSPEAFTKLGIDLDAKTIVVVKSSNHFHAAFAPIAAHILYVEGGGPYPSDPTKVTYTKVRRPISPLDPNPYSDRQHRAERQD